MQWTILTLLYRTLWGNYIGTQMLDTIRPRGYKTFFMLNSAEHEILAAYKI